MFSSPAQDSIAIAQEKTLAQLSQLKQQIIKLHSTSARATHEQIAAQYETQLKQLSVVRQQRKQERDRQRTFARSHLSGKALEERLEKLQQESQQDSLERRRLKQEREQALSRTKQQIEQTQQQIKSLKQQYETLSREWQTYLQCAYFATLAGEDKLKLNILYQDNDLVVVDKPAGLLSVPGRRYATQDSVLSQLQYHFPNGSYLQAVHRLDRDTSGILAIAKTPQACTALSQQFARRQVQKTYEAVLSKPIDRASGLIELPLWSDPSVRPKQVVDFQRGKPARTEFKRLTNFKRLTDSAQPRVQFVPHAGRTHQLRVHAAHRAGLASPILGDRLYGEANRRLHLHASSLKCLHPTTQKTLAFSSPAPF